MAFDLKAILRLDDQLTSPLSRIKRSVTSTNKMFDRATKKTNTYRDANGRLRDSMGRFVGTGNKANDSLFAMGRNLDTARGGMVKMIGTLGALAGAYGAVAGGKKLFESTVLRAAEREQSSVMIGAMFDDKKLSAEYQKMMDKIAIDSPVLDSQKMYENSKSFITASKDLKQLEKMWSLAERMAAIDPMQGIEGAVFALRELFSGDAVSMVERFEMPRAIMNDIKKMDLSDQLEALDDYFEKIGMTQKLIDEMGNTTLGTWQQVKEQMSLIFLDMGKPALEPINNFLKGVVTRLQNGELDGFKETGARWIKNIITGMINTVTAIYEWFRAVGSSEEWKSATTLSAKVDFVIENLMAKFNAWYDSTGKKAIETATETIMGAIVSFIENNSGKIAAAAWDVGSKMGSSIYEGAKSALSGSWLGKALVSAGVGGAAGSMFAGVGAIPGAIIGGGASLVNSGYKWLTRDLDPNKSHNGGLDYVPYDGYSARLHKGERVLTRQEAKEYKTENNNGGNTYNIKFTLNGGVDEETASKFADFFVKRIEEAGGAGA